MAVTQQTPLNTYTANGATTAFAFDFLASAAGDLVVQVIDTAGSVSVKSLGTDYTLTGLGVATGGTVTFLAAPANGYTVTIYRDTGLSRSTDYQANGDLPSATLDADFDRLWLALQEIFGGGKGVPNAVRAPAGETFPPLGNAAARASRVLAFDTNGDPTVIVGVDSSSAAALALDLAASNNTSKGAGQVGFAQGLAYGTSTIGAHAKRWPTAKDAPWLATGDGTTTDTTALQAFLTANAGGPCTIPPGTYKTGALTVPANTTIWGFGATLDFSAAGNVTGLNANAGGVTVIGLDILGPGNASYHDDSRGIACIGTNNSPSAPTFVVGPRVMMCKVRNWKGYGARLQYCNGGQVWRSEFTSCGYAGAAVLSSNDVLIDGNVIDGVTPGTGGGDAYGIFFDRMETGNETVEPRTYRTRIAYNVVKNVAAASGNNGQGIDTHGSVDAQIIGNMVDGCEVGIVLTASSISGVQQLACKRANVIGNTVRGSRVGYGILVSGALNGTTVNEYAQDIALVGNVVEGHGITGDNLTGAIFAQATKRLTISGGSIKEPACYGVNLGIENRVFNISGLAVTDPYDNTVTVPGAIHINGNNNTGRISDLTCSYETSGLGTYVSTTCVRVAASLTGLDVKLSGFHLIGIDSTHLSYSEATSTGLDKAEMVVQNGEGTLSSGTLAVTFAKRFPGTPKVIVSPNSAANVVRAHTISATGFTAAGTGTDTFTWRASM